MDAKCQNRVTERAYWPVDSVVLSPVTLRHTVSVHRRHHPPRAHSCRNTVANQVQPTVSFCFYLFGDRSARRKAENNAFLHQFDVIFVTTENSEFRTVRHNNTQVGVQWQSNQSVIEKENTKQVLRIPRRQPDGNPAT